MLLVQHVYGFDCHHALLVDVVSAGTFGCCSVIVWDVNQLLKTAGEMPESQSHDNHLLQLNDHGCMITAVACSDSIMASADSSGKVILHFSS